MEFSEYPQEQVLNQFLSDLINQAHPVTLPEPLRQKMMADLMIQLDQRLHEAILIALPQTDQAAYQEKILDHTPAAELQDWLQRRLTDLPELMEYVCQQFAQEYITVCTQ